MSEDVLRYRVELDSQGLASQLSSLSQTVGQGLNSMYVGGQQAFGTVSIAGETLRRDFSTFFGSPAQTSAYMGGETTNSLAYQINATSAMQGMSGLQFTPAPQFSSIDLFSGGMFSTGGLRRGLGGLLRGRGWGTRMGLEDRNVRGLPGYELARSEERAARLEDAGLELGYGAVGTLLGTMIAGPFGGFLGGTLGRSVLEPMLDPGAAVRRAGAGILADMNVGGSGRYSRAERKRFGQVFSDLQRDQFSEFFSRDEMLSGLTMGIETGAIRGRQTGRSPEELAKQVRDYMNAVKGAMRSMNLDFETASGEIGIMMGRMKMTARQASNVMADRGVLMQQTGWSAGQMQANVAAFTGTAVGLGMTQAMAESAAAPSLRAAESLVQFGGLSQYTIQRLGGAPGVAQATIGAQAAFQNTPVGNAMLMADFMRGGGVAAQMGAGTMNMQQALAPLSRMTPEQYLRFLSRRDELAANAQTSGTMAAPYVEMLRASGMAVDRETLAGMMVRDQRLGLSGSEANAVAEAYLRNTAINPMSAKAGQGITAEILSAKGSRAGAKSNPALREAEANYNRLLRQGVSPQESNMRARKASIESMQANNRMGSSLAADALADAIAKAGPNATELDIQKLAMDNIANWSTISDPSGLSIGHWLGKTYSNWDDASIRDAARGGITTEAISAAREAHVYGAQANKLISEMGLSGPDAKRLLGKTTGLSGDKLSGLAAWVKKQSGVEGYKNIIGAGTDNRLLDEFARGKKSSWWNMAVAYDVLIEGEGKSREEKISAYMARTGNVRELSADMIDKAEKTGKIDQQKFYERLSGKMSEEIGASKESTDERLNRTLDKVSDNLSLLKTTLERIDAKQ